MLGTAAVGDDEVARAIQSIWAKTDVWRRNEDDVAQWLPLACHLHDTGVVAGWLWDHWLAHRIRSRMAVELGSHEQARALVVYLAAIHDIGKATPAFALLNRRLAERMRAQGLEFPRVVDSGLRTRLPHDLAGHIAVVEHLASRGWRPREADAVAGVVGGHHGVPPFESRELRLDPLTRPYFGDGLWHECRERILRWAEEISGLDLEHVRSHRPSTAVQSLLVGLVVVADWIASAEHLFPLVDIDRLPDTVGRGEAGLDRLKFPVRLDFGADTAGASDLLFARRWPDLAAPGMRPIQREAANAVRSADEPCLVVIEAPMGSGKTEAALLAAEILAGRLGCTGAFVALPTQATTNAMFGRIAAWLERMRLSRPPTFTLLHGKRELNPAFQELVGRPMHEASGENTFDERARPFVHRWMLSPRRSPLSDFTVATVDQLLFGALQARHTSLRHLGLASKVVIIDEVHSYDAYMRTYLERALEWLGAQGVPVVLLSATLASGVRRELADAYARGRRSVVRDAGAAAAGGYPRAMESEPADVPYPRIAAWRDGHEVAVAVEADGRRLTVDVELIDDDVDALIGLLSELLEDGGCAAVVRNTVARAQEAYARLSEVFGEDVVIVHSRFIDADRAAIDAQLVEELGPGRRTRPRRIVVGTQVVEQSLDIDFDVMVTDLAPIDVVFQRLGRLHRHERPRPGRLARPRVVVTGVADWSSSPVRLDPRSGAGRVYAEYDLLTSAALLISRANAGLPIELPDDIPRWVEAAYGGGEITPPEWHDAVDRARIVRDREVAGQRTRARTFLLPSPRPAGSLVGWLRLSRGDVDEGLASGERTGRAQVRDADESYEAILVFRARTGDLLMPPWVAMRAGFPPECVSHPTEAQAREIATCAIRVAAWQLGGGDAVDRWIDECQRSTPTSWRDDPHLRDEIALVLDMVAQDEAEGVLAGCRFRYRRETGLEVERVRGDRDGEGR